MSNIFSPKNGVVFRFSDDTGMEFIIYKNGKEHVYNLESINFDISSKDKHIIEQIKHISFQTSRILDDISVLPSLEKTNSKIIDLHFLKLKRKMYKLHLELNKITNNNSEYSETEKSSCEQIFNKFLHTFLDNHPLYGKILTFLICTIVTIILTVIIENIMTNYILQDHFETHDNTQNIYLQYNYNIIPNEIILLPAT